MLGSPAQGTEAFLIGFLRRDYGAAGLFSMAKAGMLSNLQVMVSLVTLRCFILALANLLVIIKVYGGGKVAAGMALFIFPLRIAGGGRGELLRPMGGDHFLNRREIIVKIRCPLCQRRDRSVGQRLPVRIPMGKDAPCLLPGCRILFPHARVEGGESS